MTDGRGLSAAIAAVADATAFSGVVRVDVGSDVRFERAFGLAHRAATVANMPDTRFGIASGTKIFTALVVVSLVEQGMLAMDTTARSLLGPDLPLVDDTVTVEHLLSHRSGIGDYLDEGVETDRNGYVLTVPPHRLDSTESYLAVLDGHPQKFAPGTGFSYCNGGYVLLALLAERAAREPFPDLVERLVCRPAGLTSTAFLRSDALPAGVAVGYLEAEGDRSNVLHLPVLGSGDGGLTSTVADIHALWTAFTTGRIVGPDRVADMTQVRGRTPRGTGYGLGLWRPAEGVLEFEGADAGVSFRSVHDRRADRTWTVVSNTTLGAWPMVEALETYPW